MNSDDYKQIAIEISKRLNDYFSNFCDAFPQYHSIKNDYLKKRVHLNGVQFYAGYISGKSDKWADSIEVPIAIEMVMLWAYKTNRILDEKQEIINNKESIKATVLEHDVMLACIYDLLEVFSKRQPKYGEKVKSLVETMLSKLSFGFWLERNKLNVNFLSIEEIIIDWKDNYLARNLNFNLVYEYAPLIGYGISVGNFDIIDKYFSFFPLQLRFSNVGQMINDLGDFGEDIDSNIKSFQDMFSDIRNGIITFPVHELISNNEILKALKKSSLTVDKSWQNKVRKLISDNAIDEEVIKLASSSYEKYKEFFETYIIDFDPLLLKTFGMLTNNKFFDQKIVSEVSPYFRNRVTLSGINGRELGTYNILLAHKEGKLHKSYSVFIFDKNNNLLIQKAYENENHFGSYWSNTSSGHLLPGENKIEVAKKKIKENFGISCELKKKFSFVYEVNSESELIEHEFNTVLIGNYDGKVLPNPQEIVAVKWVKIDELLLSIKNKQEQYSNSFKKRLERMGYR